MDNLPLTVDEQYSISSRKLARLILELLIRNDQMPADERRWKLSYYPYQLSVLRSFEIVGHANPEVPGFARKWNEAIALLKAQAFIMPDPSQDNHEDFALPTSFATPEAVDSQLGAA